MTYLFIDFANTRGKYFTCATFWTFFKVFSRLRVFLLNLFANSTSLAVGVSYSKNNSSIFFVNSDRKCLFITYIVRRWAFIVRIIIGRISDEKFQSCDHNLHRTNKFEKYSDEFQFAFQNALTFVALEKQAIEITLAVFASFQIFLRYNSIMIFCKIKWTISKRSLMFTFSTASTRTSDILAAFAFLSWSIVYMKFCKS